MGIVAIGGNRGARLGHNLEPFQVVINLAGYLAVGVGQPGDLVVVVVGQLGIGGVRVDGLPQPVDRVVLKVRVLFQRAGGIVDLLPVSFAFAIVAVDNVVPEFVRDPGIVARIVIAVGDLLAVGQIEGLQLPDLVIAVNSGQTVFRAVGQASHGVVDEGGDGTVDVGDRPRLAVGGVVRKDGLAAERIDDLCQLAPVQALGGLVGVVAIFNDIGHVCSGAVHERELAIAVIAHGGGQRCRGAVGCKPDDGRAVQVAVGIVAEGGHRVAARVGHAVAGNGGHKIVIWMIGVGCGPLIDRTEGFGFGADVAPVIVGVLGDVAFAVGLLAHLEAVV